MKIYEFTRILGILLDNAIEAASECENKIIHVSFRKEQNRRRLLVIIDNTYNQTSYDDLVNLWYYYIEDKDEADKYLECIK